MAIRNIVFDLGNVLVDFDPPAYLLKCGFNAETAAHLLADVFSGAWQKGDAGDYLTVRALRDDARCGRTASECTFCARRSRTGCAI